MKSAIQKTLVYSDVFDYPLTEDEAWRFLISDKRIQRNAFEKELKKLRLSSRLSGGKQFYCLFGREEILKKRERRKKTSERKLIITKRIAKILFWVPTVLLIGISGGLALENAEKKDDIDLFIITSRGSLWVTRLTLVLLLKIVGQYRGRGKKESQKVCLNMLIDEAGLKFEKTRQDLYTAHEIAQLKPLLDRNNTYAKFVGANKWVSKFLPNGMDRIKNHESRIMDGKTNSRFIIHNSLFIFEKAAKLVQALYMKKHRTSEIVSDHFLAFHPFDYKEFVLKEYNKRLKRYAI